MSRFGRIKKRAGKIRASGRPGFPDLAPAGERWRKLGVDVDIRRAPREYTSSSLTRTRTVASYEAQACVKKGSTKGWGAKGHQGCGARSYGRTVQSATAKALKSLSQTLAKRGRKKR